MGERQSFVLVQSGEGAYPAIGGSVDTFCGESIYVDASDPFMDGRSVA